MLHLFLFGAIGVDAATWTPPAAPPAVTRRDALPADVLDYFRGRWAGSGRFVRSGKPVGSTTRFEPVADGQALLVRHEELPPNGFAFAGLWSVDKRSGGLVMMIAGNKGGGARLLRSAGWQGDRLVFHPDPALRTDFALERMTFQRFGPARFSVRYETSRDGTAWGGGDVQTFTRQAD